MKIKYKGATELKKFEDGGRMTDSKYTERIEALKAQIKAEKDPKKKASMMEELSRLRQLAKKEAAQIQGDTMKEQHAKMAEKSGDKGRAQRIRSSKLVQEGVEESVKSVTVKSNSGKLPKKNYSRVDPAKLKGKEREEFIKKYAKKSQKPRNSALGRPIGL